MSCNRSVIEEEWGRIEEWNTGEVEDMSELSAPREKGTNDSFTTTDYDISAWDVSSVTDMSGMFAGASQFNWDLSY